MGLAGSPLLSNEGNEEGAPSRAAASVVSSRADDAGGGAFVDDPAVERKPIVPPPVTTLSLCSAGLPFLLLSWKFISEFSLVHEYEAFSSSASLAMLSSLPPARDKNAFPGGCLSLPCMLVGREPPSLLCFSSFFFLRTKQKTSAPARRAAPPATPPTIAAIGVVVPDGEAVEDSVDEEDGDGGGVDDNETDERDSLAPDPVDDVMGGSVAFSGRGHSVVGRVSV